MFIKINYKIMKGSQKNWDLNYKIKKGNMKKDWIFKKYNIRKKLLYFNLNIKIIWIKSCNKKLEK